MAGVNKVILVGNLGAGPRGADSSAMAARWSTCASPLRKAGRTATATARSGPSGISVAIFNENLGRVAKSYLRKGSKVYHRRPAADPQVAGPDRATTVTRPKSCCRSFRGELVLLDGREGGSGGSFGGGGGGSSTTFGGGGGGGSKPQQRPQPAAFDTDLDDDVPF